MTAPNTCPVKKANQNKWNKQTKTQTEHTHTPQKSYQNQKKNKCPQKLQGKSNKNLEKCTFETHADQSFTLPSYVCAISFKKKQHVSLFCPLLVVLEIQSHWFILCSYKINRLRTENGAYFLCLLFNKANINCANTYLEAKKLQRIYYHLGSEGNYTHRGPKRSSLDQYLLYVYTAF